MTRQTLISQLSRALPALAVLGVAGSLGACMTREVSLTGSIPVDVRDRHPIVLTDAPRSLDLYPGPGSLDPRQTDDLAAFVAEYRARGRSGIVAEAPEHGGHGLSVVRAALAQQGVPAAAISVRPYPRPQGIAAAPIRLSFASLQARVPHRCGEWPDDLGVSNMRRNALNEPYWNFGCSYQSTIAAQVADPIDLVRGRPEGRLDTVKRMKAIEKFRNGTDPSTEYRQQAATINRSVGN